MKGLGSLFQLSVHSLMPRVSSATLRCTLRWRYLVVRAREPALDLVHPGRVRRGEVEHKSRMAKEPGPHRLGLVGCVVVEHQMDRQALGDSSVDELEELDELLGPVSLGHRGDDRAGGDIEGSVEVANTVAPVLGGATQAAPLVASGAWAGCDPALGSGSSRRRERTIAASRGVEVDPHHVSHLTR
jgi:hypothetical protein